MRRSPILFLLLLFSCLAAIGTGVIGQESNGIGYLLSIDGTIGPATTDYVDRALDRAEERKAELVILRMDTPGGLDTSMRAIIKRIITSEVPVVCYVSPGGARAASAGTYILFSSHIAAMAPGTNLGAATPVELIGIPQSDPGEKPDNEEGKGEEATKDDPGKRKLINDAAAYIRSLAQLRGRNTEWAESAVREAASLSAEEALESGVIDLLADNLPDLLRKIDNRTVQTLMGTRTLESSELDLESLEPDWQSELLSIISNPNLAYLLMLVGIYGLIYEFANPGSILPGTAGAIALLLALYAFHLLPVNYAGIALILLGLTLMVAEAFVPSFGALGIGGAVAFVFGSLILIDTDLPGYGISIPLVLTLAAASAFLLVFVVGMALKSHRKPVVSGREELIGADGIVLDDFSDMGRIRVHGEIWNARSATPLLRNQRVEITGLEGLTLDVKPTDDTGDTS